MEFYIVSIHLMFYFINIVKLKHENILLFFLLLSEKSNHFQNILTFKLEKKFVFFKRKLNLSDRN
jgi:hypothetical protein